MNLVYLSGLSSCKPWRMICSVLNYWPTFGRLVGLCELVDGLRKPARQAVGNRLSYPLGCAAAVRFDSQTLFL